MGALSLWSESYSVGSVPLPRLSDRWYMLASFCTQNGYEPQFHLYTPAIKLTMDLCMIFNYFLR